MLFNGGDLEVLKTALSKTIDDEAEACRSSYITLGAGQALVYMQKQREAELILSGNYTPDQVPNLYAEAADLGVTIEQAATVVMQKAQEWAYVSSAIETARLGAKRGVANATTPAEARAAAVVVWPTLG